MGLDTMGKLRDLLRKASTDLIRYFECLSCAASAALLVSAIIMPTASCKAMVGCLVCVFIGAILVVWRKSKE